MRGGIKCVTTFRNNACTVEIQQWIYICRPGDQSLCYSQLAPGAMDEKVSYCHCNISDEISLLLAACCRSTTTGLCQSAGQDPRSQSKVNFHRHDTKNRGSVSDLASVALKKWGLILLTINIASSVLLKILAGYTHYNPTQNLGCA